MTYTLEELIEKLNKHASDWREGKTQDFEEVCIDCENAANMLSILKASKHTQKRRRQRLSKKNREKKQKIEALTVELAHLKG